MTMPINWSAMVSAASIVEGDAPCTALALQAEHIGDYYLSNQLLPYPEHSHHFLWRFKPILTNPKDE